MIWNDSSTSHIPQAPLRTPPDELTRTSTSSSNMYFAGYSQGDVEPAAFIAQLVDRLSEIQGSIWSTEISPWHTSYGDWHVLGTIPKAEEMGYEKGRSSISSQQSIASTSTKSGKGEDSGTKGRVKVVARISKNILRLERQYQMNISLLGEWDPSHEKHLRALQLIRLPSRRAGEIPLVVILMEHPGI